MQLNEQPKILEKFIAMRRALVVLLGLLAFFCYPTVESFEDVVHDTVSRTNLELIGRKGMKENRKKSKIGAEIIYRNIQLKPRKFKRFLNYNHEFFLKKGKDETANDAEMFFRSSNIRLDDLNWMMRDLSELQMQELKGIADLEQDSSLGRTKRSISRILPFNCSSSLVSCKDRCMKERDAGGTQHLRCSCDPYCNYFKDCCADYIQYCLGQRSSNITQTSIKVPDEPWSCRSGIWMIASCPQSWTNKDINESCSSITSMTADNYEDVLPVVTANNKTYANRFCAQCHGLQQHELSYYNIHFKSLLSAPHSASVQERINFLFKYGEGVNTKPPGDTPRRYCYKTIEKCSQKSVSNEIRGKCEYGTFGLVYSTRSKTTFKNINCAHCNYVTKALECGPGKDFKSNNYVPGKARPFSLVMDFGTNSNTRSRKTTISCPKSQVYDVHLETCRYGQRFVPAVSETKKYHVGLWMKIKGKYVSNLQLFDEKLFTRFFSQALMINSTAITSVKINCLDIYNYFYFIEFNLDVSEYKSNTSYGGEMHSCLPPLLHEKNLPFVLKIIIFSFDVIKVSSYPLTCSQLDIFSSNEYHPLRGRLSSSVYINITGEVLTSREYFSNASKVVAGVVVPIGDIVVCRQILTRNCSDGTFIFLHRQEYTIYPNRSMLYKAPGHLYERGTYMWKNGTIMICTDFTATYEQGSQSVSGNDHKALTILTYIGFCISVGCLLFVLVTYSIFADLRTIPGINLMNLCCALLVAQVLWLVGSGWTFTQLGCMVIAIVLHYSFLASFWWMSIIAFSTWRAFSGKASTRNYRNENGQKKRKRILRTMAMGWFPLVMYVSTCVALDRSETVTIDYGGEKGCWINSPRANLFFFAVPVGLSMLWNAVFFVLIIKEIKKAIDQSQMVASQHQARQDLTVYARIAVLMGFTWVFGFVAPFTSYYLMYPFVILNTLQGLYIAVAFGCNRRVRALYGNKRMKSNCKPNERGQPTRSNITKKTEL